MRGFWAELVAAWRRDPRIHVREIEWTLRYAGAVLDGTADDGAAPAARPDPDDRRTTGRWCCSRRSWPASPMPRYGDFSSGNVLDDPAAGDPGAAPRGTPAGSAEFLAGVEACRAPCPYFGFCGGAHAANRYFEHGRFDGTETEHCRNSKIRLLEGVLDHAREHQSTRLTERVERHAGGRTGAEAGRARRAARGGRGGAAAPRRGGGRGRRERRLRLEPLREHPDVLQLEQPAPLSGLGSDAGPRADAVRSTVGPWYARTTRQSPARRADGHTREHAGVTACSAV